MKGKEKKWDLWQRKSVAVLGAGISGNGAAALLKKLRWDYVIYDEQGRAFTDEEARGCSVVICSPGFKQDHPWRLIAKECGKKVITETEFGATFTDSKIVVVTGTNGKTTLATFLTHLWKSINRPAITAGNVGLPLSKVVADGLSSESTIFLETSSFQSEDMKSIRPESVLWTNFACDHLDRHGTEKKYFYAKANLLKLVESGVVMIGESVDRFAEGINYSLPTQTRIIKRKDAELLTLRGTNFLSTYPQVENMAIAQAFSSYMGVSKSDFSLAVESYISEPHRLQEIGSIGDATFWNDSKSTNFASAIAACKNFKGNLFWLGGGQFKGGLVEEFTKKLKPLVQNAFLFGESGQSLANNLLKEGLSINLCESLEDAVNKAFTAVIQKTHILLSPGFASFDSFKDYSDRGNSFIKYVLDLKKLTSVSTHNNSLDFIHH